MVIFHSYVSLPEGTTKKGTTHLEVQITSSPGPQGSQVVSRRLWRPSHGLASKVRSSVSSDTSRRHLRGIALVTIVFFQIRICQDILYYTMIILEYVHITFLSVLVWNKKAHKSTLATLFWLAVGVRCCQTVAFWQDRLDVFQCFSSPAGGIQSG